MQTVFSSGAYVHRVRLKLTGPSGKPTVIPRRPPLVEDVVAAGVVAGEVVAALVFVLVFVVGEVVLVALVFVFVFVDFVFVVFVFVVFVAKVVALLVAHTVGLVKAYGLIAGSMLEA